MFLILTYKILTINLMLGNLGEISSRMFVS